jgi:hypothetical protein
MNIPRSAGSGEDRILLDFDGVGSGMKKWD